MTLHSETLKGINTYIVHMQIMTEMHVNRQLSVLVFLAWDLSTSVFAVYIARILLQW